MCSLPHISTSDIGCTSQNRIHRTMQRIFYKRKIVRTFDFRQLNLTKFLSTTKLPLNFRNRILPSSSISSRDSCSQKNRKNQILYPLFHTFSKNYILKSENQYTPLLQKNKKNFRPLHYLIKAQSKLVASTMLSFILIISSIISLGARGNIND